MSQPIKTIETDFAKIYLLENNIGHVHFKENTRIDESVQNQLFKIYQELSTKPIPFIYSSDEFLSASKGAPELSKKIEAKSPINMKALVIRNLAQRILAKYYYKIHQPINPYKIFTTFDEALSWVNENRISDKASA